MTNGQTIVLMILALNVVTFCVFWWDKEAARDGDWRVPEKRLLAFAFFGGSIGAVTAQQFLRHKTRKEPFRSSLMLIVAIHVLSLTAWLTTGLWVPGLHALLQ